MDLTKIVVGGPCKITDGATVIYTEGAVTLDPQPTWRNIPSDVGGDHDSVLTDLMWRIGFTPKSVYAYAGTLVPTAYTNWVTSGARIIGAVDRAVTILGSDGQQYALRRATVTRMPDIYLGLGKSIWGACEYTAYIGFQKNLTDADAFFTPSSGQVWSQADYPTGHQEAQCTANWGGVNGFTAMYAEEGFQITHELRMTPIKQGNVTVDQRLESYRAACLFRPQQPSEAQMLAAAQFAAGSSLGIGTRLSSQSHDLVISDGSGGGLGAKVTVASVGVQRGQFVFDNKLTRLGEWGFLSAGTTPIGTRLTLATN